MNRFVVAMRWRGPAPDRSDLAPLVARMGRRSLVSESFRSSDAAIVVESAPAARDDPDRSHLNVSSEPGLRVVFEGRIDNRGELLADLGLAPWSAVDDRTLASLAWNRWGAAAARRVIGPAVMVAIDDRARRVTLTRDALGDRTVVYAELPDGVVVASSEYVLLAHPAIPDTLDEDSLVRFLAVRPPRVGHTFFAAVREVPAGCTVEIDVNGARLHRHWSPEYLTLERSVSDREWIERFRATLNTAVACRMPDDVPPAVLMSGGLDSTSVAAHAATLLGPGHRLHTISWVFDELPDADERAFIRPMIDRYDLDASLLAGDGLWPLRDRRSWPLNPNMPCEGIYRSLYSEAYRIAVAKGTPVILTGEMGDQLYGHACYWLADSISGGRWGELARHLHDDIRRFGPRGAWPLVRSALGRLLGVSRPATCGRPWLTPQAARRLACDDRTEARLRSDRARRVVDDFASFALARDVATAANQGVDIRRPFRDRRLVELVLRMPAHLFIRDGFTKWILREAGRDLLPEPVRLRRRFSTLLPLCARGFAEREHRRVLEIARSDAAGWRGLVSPDWLDHHLARAFPEDSVQSVAAWHCVALELWHRVRAELDDDAATPLMPRQPGIAYTCAGEDDAERTA